jgi:predicted Ser/Thr protein kinase
MGTQQTCPSCGKALAGDAPQGICPECLMKAGFGTASGREGGGDGGFDPPPVEGIGRLFPQLEILELIGKGGMGAVYKARQPGLDRVVALKILPPRGGSDPGFAERFTREARALARLAHPNIVGVYDFGQVSGAGVPSGSGAGGAQPSTLEAQTTLCLHYFLMEYVDGPNLRQVERAGKLSPPQALRIIPQICEALQYAHDEGIVHRDIKPENVLLDKKGRVKIADFGLAKILGREAQDFRLTGAGQVMGTPNYMAPEQVEHPQAVDHRADIYSLGVVFYEMLTGALPLGKFAPPSRKVEVDVRLDEVVMHALENEPERRYQHASQIKSDVETIAATPDKTVASIRAAALPAARRSSGWKIAVAGGLGLAALFMLLGLLALIIGTKRKPTPTVAATDLAGSNAFGNVKGNSSEVLKLRAEVTRLRGEASQANDPIVQAALAWEGKKEALQKLFEERPGQRIPEMRLLSDAQWLDVAKDRDLESETGIRQALSQLRKAAKRDFAAIAAPAVAKYEEDNDGRFPTDLSQLQQYFKAPVDEAILQRYGIFPAEARSNVGLGGQWVIAEKGPVDADYDECLSIGAGGWGYGYYHNPGRTGRGSKADREGR